MKQINLWSGRSYLVEDEKFESIKRALASGDTKAIVSMPNGDFFVVSAIEGGCEPETEPYYLGNKMNKGMTRVLVGGDWKNFCGDRNEIEQRPILTNNNLQIK